MSFITLQSDLGFKGFTPDRVSRSSVHVAGGVEDNDLEPGTNLEGNDTNQNFTLRLFTDPGDQSLGGVTPPFIRNKDSIFIKGDDFDFPDDTDIGFNIDGSSTNQGFQFEEGIDPGDQSRKGKTPGSYQRIFSLGGSKFVLGDEFISPEDSTLRFTRDVDPTGLSLGGVKPREYRIEDSRFIGNDGSPNLIFELGIDPGVQSLDGKTPPRFTDTPYSQHVDNPTDPNQVLGIIDKELSVEPRSRTNTILEQIGVLAKKRLDDVARITTKVINPIENPRFITNQGIIAFATALDASLKASGGEKLSAFGKAAKDGGLDIAKTYSGILASTPVAGTGIHLIFPPAVNNQYLQQNSENPTRLLDNIAAFTGITAGSGVNGANLAYTKGQVQEGFVTSNFVELDEDNVTVKDIFLLPKQVEGLNREIFTEKLAYEEVKNKGYYNEKNVNIVDNFNNSLKKPSIGIRTKMVSTGQESRGSLDYVTFESIEIGDETSNVADDIIPFNIEIYDPEIPDKFSLIKLRAYLDSISDSFTGEWNSTKYIGRAEQLYNYTGFNRDFSFSFKVAALSKRELIPLYFKLNLLAGTTAPVYDDEQNFMKGVFTKLTIGDYLYKVPGFFEKIGLTWDTKYPWELGLEDSSMHTLPHILNVDVTFRPIHNFNPKFGSDFIGKIESDLIGEDGRQGSVIPKEELNSNTTLTNDNVNQRTFRTVQLSDTAQNIADTIAISRVYASYNRRSKPHIARSEIKPETLNTIYTPRTIEQQQFLGENITYDGKVRVPADFVGKVITPRAKIFN